MEKKVLDFILEHQLIEKNKKILVGVSGGPDSMALVHLLASLRDAWNLKIHIITVDHQLRGKESEADIIYVKQMCEKWQLPFTDASIDVQTYKKKYKVTTQVAARQLRYEVFDKKMKEIKADYLALGHHGDDQIETLIMSLARTTNLSSLTGIPVRREFADGHIIRPLLSVTKQEIERYCELNQINPRIDSTNEDTYYTRNSIRKLVVPHLKERNSNLHTTMQLLSENLQEDETFLLNEAKKVFTETINIDKKNKKADLFIPDFTDYPLSLQRRVYRLTLDYLYDDVPEQLTYIHEQIFFSLLKKEMANKIIHFPKQLCLEKSYNKVLFYFPQPKTTPFHKVINKIPECITLPNGAIVSIKYSNEPNWNNLHRHTYVCLEEELIWPLHIRTRKHGDRMSYEGLTGSKKIKDIFIDEKIPRAERDSIYILTDDTDEILWVIGLRKKGLPKVPENNQYIIFEYKGHGDLSEEEKNAKRH